MGASTLTSLVTLLNPLTALLWLIKAVLTEESRWTPNSY